MKNIITKIAITIGVLSFSQSSWSSNKLHPEVMSIATEWAEITYQNDAKNRKSALSNLQSRAEALLLYSPNNENLLAWSGIITASHAGEVGGLKALKIVKKAKKHLEKAMEINPDALNGGARTSLGALYYQVPGWPIAFGSNKKAEQFLSESVSRFPDDLNTLYFMADFLIDQNRNSEAIAFLEKASKIEPRIEFHIADSGRLEAIHSTLSKIQQNN